jgi:hypothetical protein
MTVLTMSDAHIRRAQETEHAALVRLWERSVRATHDFLTEADIVHLRPLVAEYFAGPATDLWVLTDERDVPIGFLGVAGDSNRGAVHGPDPPGPRRWPSTCVARAGDPWRCPDRRRERAEREGVRFLRSVGVRGRRTVTRR